MTIIKILWCYLRTRHLYTQWEDLGRVRGRVLLARECIRCGWIQTWR